jgi:hypothetical protein
VLDDFGDNLTLDADDGCAAVRDPALAALLAGWAGKLLILCDTPFVLPEPGPGRFVFRRLGPLTRSGAAEFALAQPALRTLAESQRDLAWRLTAGHPRALEYLDALLAAGVPFGDVAVRVGAAVQETTGHVLARTDPTELAEPAAQCLAEAAGQQLLGELISRLTAGARDLLVRASVFRVPVEPGVLAARPANLAEGLAAGLLRTGPGRELAVPRWTASGVHRSLREAGQAAELAQAHREAAAYWQARIGVPSIGARAQLEASHHLRQVAALTASPVFSVAAGPAARLGSRGRRRLRRLGLASVAGAAVTVLAVEAAGGLSASHLASAERPEGTGSPAPLSETSSVRDQAAGWVDGEVGTGTILACDPAMCSVLVAHGIPAANLLVLGPGAGDPLGSDVVVATPAVRSMFGSRLATVYAPQTLASFGAGAAQIDVRVVAPNGAAAYRTALAADLRSRRGAGLQLLASAQVSAAAQAREQLAAGQVDSRLLIVLAALAHSAPVQIASFADAGPGASSGTPLRTVQLTAPPSDAQAMLAFVRAQRPPYLALHSSLSGGAGGPQTLTVQFAAPGPLGLLAAAP